MNAPAGQNLRTQVIRMLAAGAAATLALSNVHAQTRAGLPGRMSGLGGVRSQPAPRIPFGPSLSQPAYRPMRVGPFPGVNNTPPTPTPYHGGGGRRGGGPAGGWQGGDGGRGDHGDRGGHGERPPPVYIPGQPTMVGPTPNGGMVVSPGYPGMVYQPAFGSGLTVNGRYSGDKWNVGFHLGAGAASHCVPVWCPDVRVPIVSGCFPAWWYSDSWSYWGNQYGTFYGNYEALDPAFTTPPPPAPSMTETPPPSNDRELGDVYLRAGDTAAAIKAYRAYLVLNRFDAIAMRSLGLALIDQGDISEGVAMVSMAYRTDPLIGGEPVPIDVFEGGASGMRRNLERVSVFANRVRSASAWLTLAAMMQSEGRTDVALTMVQRASAAGLDKNIAGPLTAALGG